MEPKAAIVASRIDREVYLAKVVSFLESRTIFKAMDLSVWTEE